MIVATAEQMDRAKRYLGTIPGAAERAMARALNAAVKAAQLEAFAKIVERYEVSDGDVRARMDVKLASPRHLGVALRAKSPSLPLHYFPHAPSAPGTGGPGKAALSVTVLRGQAKTVAGAFIARLGVKPRIVIRTGEQTRSGRDQLRVLYSTPIAVMLGTPPIRLAVEERAMQALDDKLGSEIDRELKAVA